MTTDRHQVRHQARPQACLTCKSRKKKCNRAFPCSYCILKDLECHYVPPPRRRVYATPTTDSPSQSVHYSEPLTAEPHGFESVPRRTKARIYFRHPECLDEIHPKVQNIIQSTGEFVDDLTAHYFKNFHRHLPIISRARFQDNLLGAGGEPPRADHSVLLLTICLIAYQPNPDQVTPERNPPVIGRQSLYLATKALLAQVQGLLEYSISLIQSSLLLAAHEYANGRPQVALVTISGCARMAYAAGIHDIWRRNMSGISVTEVQEAANIWWGIVMFERAIICEINGGFEQPMATIVPSGDTQLPLDREILDRRELSLEAVPNIPVASWTATNICGFGRAAQATCLLDQVIRGLLVPDLNSRLPLLESLDRAIQSLLTLILPQSNPRCPWPYCTSLAIAVKALYTLHNHIINIQPPQTSINANLRPLEDWKSASLAALDTTTRMLVDMAKYLTTTKIVDATKAVSPIHIYEIQAALDYMRFREEGGDSPWDEGAAEGLQVYLDTIRIPWVGLQSYSHNPLPIYT
ncbi:hypothetical protein BJX70DRAFT_69381 [Aspergillus crustosus]